MKNLRFLRGTALDVFGYTEERRTERALIREYEDTVARLLPQLTAENHAVAVQLASLPEEIRGYGHIKLKSIVAARAKRELLLSQFAGRERQKAAA